MFGASPGGGGCGPVQDVAFQTDGTPGATLDGEAAQTVFRGDDCASVEAHAPPGYEFSKWTADGADYSTTNPLTVTDVTEDITLTAVFVSVSSAKDWRLYE